MPVSMEPASIGCETPGCKAQKRWVVKKDGVKVGEYCTKDGNRVATAMAKPPVIAKGDSEDEG